MTKAIPMTAATVQEVKHMVCVELQRHGYTLNLDGYGQLVATKVFASIVGDKMAYVELTGFSNDSVTLFLTGHMESEGRNCLVNCAAYIPKPVSQEAVTRYVAAFSASVNETVAGLVIVRLLEQPTAVLANVSQEAL